MQTPPQVKGEHTDQRQRPIQIQLQWQIHLGLCKHLPGEGWAHRSGQVRLQTDLCTG